MAAERAAKLPFSDTITKYRNQPGESNSTPRQRSQRRSSAVAARARLQRSQL